MFIGDGRAQLARARGLIVNSRHLRSLVVVMVQMRMKVMQRERPVESGKQGFSEALALFITALTRWNGDESGSVLTHQSEAARKLLKTMDHWAAEVQEARGKEASK